MGWRITRSYYAFIQDLATAWERKPVRSLDLAHQHDRLRLLKLSHEDSGAIYVALSASVKTYDDSCQLLCVTPESNSGLFYISLGLFHPNSKVRASMVDLLERTMGHDAGTQLFLFLQEVVAYLNQTITPPKRPWYLDLYPIPFSTLPTTLLSLPHEFCKVAMRSRRLASYLTTISAGLPH